MRKGGGKAGRKPDAPALDLGSLTAQELAGVLGVNRSAVSNWSADGAPSVGEARNRRYCLIDVVNWRLARAEATGGGRRAKSKSTGDADKELTLWRRARRRLAEVELARRRGRLLERTVVVGAMAGQATDARLVLAALPDRIGLLVADPMLRAVVEAQVTNAVNGALRLLSRPAPGKGIGDGEAAIGTGGPDGPAGGSRGGGGNRGGRPAGGGGGRG